jgi:protease I
MPRLQQRQTPQKGIEMPDITKSKILIISTDGFEQSELLVPLEKLKTAGAEVHVATLDGAAITGWDNNNWGKSVEANLKIADVNVEDYDALVLPGGQINPDILRADKTAVQKVKDFVTHDKIVAAICHAPWLLIEAGVVEGREMTAYHSIHTDLRNAGANVVDKEVAISNGIITSRSPDDLDAFVAKIIEEVKEGEHARDAA